MKKLSEKQRQRNIVISRKRLLKRSRNNNLNRYKNPAKLNNISKIKLLKTKYSELNIKHTKNLIMLEAPAVMRLSENNDLVMLFLKCIREMVLINKIGLKVDFSTIKDLSPLCAMLLATEIHRWQLIKKKRLVVIDSDNWVPKIKSLLRDIGIFDIVDVTNPYYTDSVPSDEKFISIRSEKQVNLEEALKKIENEVQKVALMFKTNPLLYGGIEEAITNVSWWAYPKNDNTIPIEIRNRWWFLTSYNHSTKRITIMVYDHGVGIPKTLPTSNRWESARSWFDSLGLNTWSDDKIIEAAIKAPRSASGLSYRAKGLTKMKELLSRFDKGTLFIYSGYGEYRVDEKNNDTIKLHKNSIGGTLIVWEVYAKEDIIDE